LEGPAVRVIGAFNESNGAAREHQTRLLLSPLMPPVTAGVAPVSGKRDDLA